MMLLTIATEAVEKWSGNEKFHDDISLLALQRKS